jgi:hypothetical protein
MREGTLVAACALVVANAGGIARAHPHEPHPEHVEANLVCTSGAHHLTEGDRHPIDADVTCEIDAGLEEALDGGYIGTIDVAMAEPFGGTANASAVVSGDNGVWRSDAFGLGSDLLRCADATFHAQLHHHDQLVWEQTLHVKPSCPRVTLRKPVFDCHKIIHIDEVVTEGEDKPPPPPDMGHTMHASFDCTVTVAGAPAGVALSASFRRAVDPSTVDTYPLDPDRQAASASYPTDEATCKPIRVDAVITRDGGIVWTGRASYTPGCHPVTP